MDCHLSLPRVECLAAAAVMRAVGPLPDPTGPADYERVLRPVYGLAYGARPGRLLHATSSRPSERAWRIVSPPIARRRPRPPRRDRRGRRRRRPATVWALNRAPSLGVPTRPHRRGDLRQRDRRRRPSWPAASASTRRPRDHRPHPPRRPPRRGRGMARCPAAAPPQHRQLGLLLRLPPPRHPAQPLLAGDGHLGRGRRPARGGSSLLEGRSRESLQATTRRSREALGAVGR